MAKRKQHKVGERFEMCKLIYEVRESVSCEGCALFIEEENHCTDGHGDNFEPCSNINRDDRKSVIFVQFVFKNEESRHPSALLHLTSYLRPGRRSPHSANLSNEPPQSVRIYSRACSTMSAKRSVSLLPSA